MQLKRNCNLIIINKRSIIKIIRMKEIHGFKDDLFLNFSTDFITSVARETSIVLDPVYSGKAAYHMVKQLNDNPDVFKGKKILFIHTGQLL